MAKLKQKEVLTTAPDEPKDLREEILALLKLEGETEFKICRRLAEAYDTGVYQSWGFDTFDKYSTVELKIEYRSAMNRVNVGRMINRYNIDEEQFERVGISKMKEIIHLMEEEQVGKRDVDKIMKDAEKKTFREVQDFVKTHRTTRSGGEVTKFTTFKVVMVNEAAEVLNETLKLYTEGLIAQGIENPTAAMALESMAIVAAEAFTNNLIGKIKEDVHTAQPEKVGHKKHIKSKAKEKAAKKKKAAKKSKKK